MNNDEILDVVDSDDNVIGQLERSQVYARGLCFRVVNAFLVNDAHQVWIPRRSACKKLFPLCLDTSVGGHVMAGESYENAFFRELAEELNIDAAQVTYECVTKLNPADHRVSAHMYLYLIHTNETPAYNKNDFSESYWFDIDELLTLLYKGASAKGDLHELIKILRNFLSQSKYMPGRRAIQ